MVNYGTSTASNDALIDSAQLLPYPPPFNVTSPAPSLSSPNTAPPASLPEVPVSIVLTEFHFISLFNERISSVSTLDSKTDYEEIIPLVCLALYYSNVTDSTVETLREDARPRVGSGQRNLLGLHKWISI